jgi:hypothetical protein
MKLWVLAALFAALAMVPFVLQRGTLNKVRTENAQLQARVRELVEAQKVDTNTAQSTARSENGSPSKDQLLELMRLRAEVTALRKLTNTAAGAIPAGGAPAMVAAPDPTVASPAGEGGQMLVTNRPPWNYKGFARPDDTMNTMVWAMEQGRMDLLLNSATPEAQAQIQQEFGLAHSPNEKLKAQATEILEIRPSTKHPPTENEVYMSMLVQKPAQQVIAEETMDVGGGRTIEKGQPYTMSAQLSEAVVKLQRVGNEWKFAGKIGK